MITIRNLDKNLYYHLYILEFPFSLLGNTFLNDVTIGEQDLISQTNGILNQETDTITTNIYENLDINFFNTLIMKNDNTPNEIINNKNIINERNEKDYHRTRCCICGNTRCKRTEVRSCKRTGSHGFNAITLTGGENALPKQLNDFKDRDRRFPPTRV